MKTFLLMTLLAFGAINFSFGGEFEDCVKDCKAKKATSALAQYECPNVDCKDLNPNHQDYKTITGKNNFIGNTSEQSGAAIHIQDK